MAPIIHAVSLPDKSTGLASIFGPHTYHLGYAEGVLKINIPDISTAWSFFPHSCHTSNTVSRKPLSPVAQGGTSCKSLFQVITAAGRELHELCPGSQSCCLQVEPAALLAFHWLEQVTWLCQTSEVHGRRSYLLPKGEMECLWTFAFMKATSKNGDKLLLSCTF